MPKVIHIITELNVGGAETSLYNLMRYSDRSDFTHIVMSLQDEGAFGEPIRALGVPVYTLNMNPSLPNPLALLKLVRVLRRERPDIIQTWLYHADLIGTLAAFVSPHRLLGWNIRNVTIANFQSGSRRLIFKACVALSGRADFILTNTETGRTMHVDEGYCPDHWQVIYNGFDIERFRPDTAVRTRIRAELDIQDDVYVIGQVGRFTPEKNYPGFIRAALTLLETRSDVHFIGAGKDVTMDALGALIPVQWRANFHLLGLRDDVPDLLNALDVFTLASDFEGFPNVVGEAMATGLPVVVTDVGDVTQLVGEFGIVVPVGDMDAMATAWARFLVMPDEERIAIGAAARERITTQFGIERFAQQYDAFYRKLLVEKGI